MTVSTHAGSCRKALLWARQISYGEPEPVHHAIKSPCLERLPSVLMRTGMGKSWIYREIAAGRFPPPVKIGRFSAWNTAAVDAWIETALIVEASLVLAQSGDRA